VLSESQLASGKLIQAQQHTPKGSLVVVGTGISVA